MRGDGLTSFSPMGSEDDEVELGVTAVNPIGLTKNQLKRLKTKFVEPGGKMRKLTLEEFVAALSTNHSPAETPAQRQHLYNELCTLFKKIDASCSETVDWEEFTEYMLLHMPGLNVGDGGAELAHSPQTQEGLIGAWGCGHMDMISAVSVVYDIGNGGGQQQGGRRYITVARDGYIKVWHPNLTVHKEISVGHQRNNRWLTACCWMSKSKRLAVASSSSSILFYDNTFSAPLAYIEHKDSTPLCLGYRESTESDGREREILIVGDNMGYVTVYFMDDDWAADNKQAENKIDDSKPLEFKKRPLRKKHHDGWVTKVGFVSEVQAMVTCGLDGDITLCDIQTNEQRYSPIRLHKKYGVHAWCWCRSYKFFASGGLDRQIIIWNPYTQMAMNYLQGHNAPVVDVQVNEAQHQLISMSVDKVVKVWDIQQYRCIQTFTDKTEYKPEDRLTCMVFDEALPGLVMCSSTLNILPMSVKVETNRAHAANIVRALYNDVFHQVVSGDSAGTILVWDVRTGHLEFQFRRVHGDHKLTCMAFDVSKRRLYTAAEDGEVRLWNFSSGQHLKTYTLKQSTEISGLLWAQTALKSPEGANNFIVALGVNGKIHVWPGTGKYTSSTGIEPQYVLEDTHGTGHTDDISCICSISTVGGLLATGGDDGCVVFWKIQETSSSGASPIACRMNDTTDSVQKSGSAQKLGGALEPKTPRRRPLGGKPLPSPGCDGETSGAAPLKDAAGHQVSTSAANAGTGGGAALKHSFRGSCLPHLPPIGGEPASPPAAGVAASGGGGGSASELDAGRDRSDAWPEAIGFEDDQNDAIAAGVERMIFLEHKDCLLSSHADRRVRLWSRERAEFLQRLDLLAPAPWLPPPAPVVLQSRPRSRGSTAEFEKQGKRLAAGTTGDGAAVKATASTSTAAAGSATLPPIQSKQPDLVLAAPYPLRPGLREREEEEKAGKASQVTALHSDQAANKWLFTGHRDGHVSVWDLTPLRPPLHLKHLLRQQQMHPHRQAVTQLQNFELDGQVVIVSASADWTIAMCNIRGERIGTFNGKAPFWSLADGTEGWCPELPALDTGPRPPSEEDDGLGLSGHRQGKGAGPHRYGHGNAGDMRSAGTPGKMGMRTPRGEKTSFSRQANTGQQHTGRGWFQSLHLRSYPDQTIGQTEQKYLNKLEKQAKVQQ